MNLRSLLLVMGTLAVLAGFSFLHGQVKDTQRFRVNVPTHVAVRAPTPVVVLTHDQTDDPQTFGRQRWQVDANVLRGATVSFTTNKAFTHTLDSSIKQDAQLDLAISPDDEDTWTVQVPSDRTNHATADEIATVQVQSNKPGSATIDLSVTFLPDMQAPLAQGDYEITVVGTVTAN